MSFSCKNTADAFIMKLFVLSWNFWSGNHFIIMRLSVLWTNYGNSWMKNRRHTNIKDFCTSATVGAVVTVYNR